MYVYPPFPSLSIICHEWAIISASLANSAAALVTAAEMFWQNEQINYAKWHVEFIFQRNSLNSLAACPFCVFL